MAGFFGVSIDSKVSQEEFFKLLKYGTRNGQHLGQTLWHFSTKSDERREKIKTIEGKGLVRSVLGQSFENLEGSEGVGCCSSREERPITIYSKHGKAVVFLSGRIKNKDELAKQLKDDNHVLKREDSSEIIANFLVKEKDLSKGLRWVNECNGNNKIEGAYSILVLSEQGIYATCSPGGHWPLVIAKKKGVVAVGSETTNFENLGFDISDCKDIEPGEIILLKKGKIELKDKVPTRRIQTCSFLWVYTSFPASIIRNVSSSFVRQRLGGFLAESDIKDEFFVEMATAVYDSGRSHFQGYLNKWIEAANKGTVQKIPFFGEPLIKYPYAVRSYIYEDQWERDLEAWFKLLRNSGIDYLDKDVVLLDDSIVRGTQLKKVVQKLRDLGFSKIHLRISYPEILSYCKWGNTTKKGEPLAWVLPEMKNRVKFLDVDSLKYNSINNLVRAIGIKREELCVDCLLPDSDI